RFSRDWSSDVCSSDLNHHVIPLTERLFGTIRKVDNSPALAFGDAPVFLRPSSRFHVGYRYVFHDAPEIARVFMHHLYFDRLWKQIGRASCREQVESMV